MEWSGTPAAGPGSYDGPGMLALFANGSIPVPKLILLATVNLADARNQANGATPSAAAASFRRRSRLANVQPSRIASAK